MTEGFPTYVYVKNKMEMLSRRRKLQTQSRSAED